MHIFLGCCHKLPCNAKILSNRNAKRFVMSSQGETKACQITSAMGETTANLPLIHVTLYNFSNFLKVIVHNNKNGKDLTRIIQSKMLKFQVRGNLI